MKCEEVQEQLSEYLDTLQGGAVARGIETHLAGCAHCAEALADLAECRRLIAALPQVEPPIGFTTRVMAHVRETAARPNWRQRLFFPLPIKLPIQATAILVIGVLSVYLLQKEQSRKQLLPGQEPSVLDGGNGQAKRESGNSPTATPQAKSEALGDAAITQGQPQAVPKPEALSSLGKRPPSSEKEVTEARRLEFATRKDSLSSLSPARPAPSRAANAPASEKSASVPPAVTSSELPARPSKPIAGAIGVSQRAGALITPMASPSLDILIPGRGLRMPLAERSLESPAQPVADYEVVVRRHPLPPRQEPTVPQGSSSLSSRDENDNAKMADGNDAAARSYGAAPSVVITSWHRVPANRYEQFKKDLATQGPIESETPPFVQERESLFRSSEPLTIKVTILPPLPSDATR